MPKLIQQTKQAQAEIPPGLKPFIALGVDILSTPSIGQATAHCPFCGKDGKFYINIETGLFDCKRCSVSGNPLGFLRHLWTESDKATRDYKPLVADRPPISEETLVHWGCAKSLITGKWLIPEYDLTGKVHMLLRWTRLRDSMPTRLHDKEKNAWYNALLPIPGIWPEGRVHGICGLITNAGRSEIRVCEGPWDGMTLWQTMRDAGRESEADVIAVPGANICSSWWGEYFAKKRVVLLYDNDHPRKHPTSGNELEPVGFSGMRRMTRMLTGFGKPPSEVAYLRWSDPKLEETGYNPRLPDGFDLRDHFTDSLAKHQSPTDSINVILAMVKPVPDEWKSIAITAGPGSGQRQTLTSAPCEDWKTLLTTWRKAMLMRKSMEDVLTSMLAVSLSTVQQGDGQLFLQVIGDAGSGKTQFCTGLLVSKTCYAIEHLTGLHSGWKDQSGEDFSILARSNGKTWITPEADVIMSSPHFAEVMSQIRRAFDGESSNEYKNQKEKRQYTGLRTPWIMAGTPALIDVNQSRLGDRFLRIMLTPPDSEDEKLDILRTVGFSTLRSVVQSVNGSVESHTEALKLKAFQLTGGFVDYLRAHSDELITNIVQGTDTDQLIHDTTLLAMFTADMRASPGLEVSHDRREKAVTKELPTRLQQQFVRMTTCLAAVLGDSSVSTKAFQICRKISLDTCNKRSIQLCKLLHTSGRDGMPTLLVANTLGKKEEEKLRMLKFLSDIQVVEAFRPVLVGMRTNERRWRLTERFLNLWSSVYGK